MELLSISTVGACGNPDSNPPPHSVVALGWIHIMSIAVAIAAAVVGIRLERPPIYAATALLIALFSFVIFVG
jgi:hypothetical protein